MNTIYQKTSVSKGKYNLFIALVRSFIDAKGKCSLSQSKIAQMLGLSRRQIIRYFKLLKEDPCFSISSQFWKPLWVLYSCLSASLLISNVTLSKVNRNNLHKKHAKHVFQESKKGINRHGVEKDFKDFKPWDWKKFQMNRKRLREWQDWNYSRLLRKKRHSNPNPCSAAPLPRLDQALAGIRDIKLRSSIEVFAKIVGMS